MDLSTGVLYGVVLLLVGVIAYLVLNPTVATPAPAPAAVSKSAKKEKNKKASKVGKVAARVPEPVAPVEESEDEEEEPVEQPVATVASAPLSKSAKKNAKKKEKAAVPAPAPVKAALKANPAPVKAAPKAAAPVPVPEPLSKSALRRQKEKAKEAKKEPEPTQPKQAAAQPKQAQAAAQPKQAQAAAQPKQAQAAVQPKQTAAPKNQKSAKEAALEAELAKLRQEVEQNAAPEDGWSTTASKKKDRAEKKKEKAAVEELSAPTVSSKVHEINIPSSQYGKIIGTNGKTLADLQTATGTKINIPKAGAGTIVTITGDAAGVDKARAALKDIVQQGYSSLLLPPSTLTTEISVDEKFLGRIIGASGSNIKRIQDHTGVKINLPPQGSKSSKITLVGKTDEIRRAKEIIDDLLSHGYSPVTHPDQIKVELPIKASDVRFIVGPKGQTIKSIQGDTNTKINTPKADDINPVVTIVGTSEGVKRAEKQILKVIAPPEEPETEALGAEWEVEEEEQW